MANRSLGAIQIMLLLIEVVILIGLAQPSLSSPGTRMPMCLRAAVQIKEVHQATLIQASETGDYISHAALLMAENYYAPELVIDRCSTRTSWLLGNFDISTYDYSVEHELRLRANVAAQDPNAAFYALGDFQFVRLKQPTGDPGIVFGWTHATDPGGRYVVFDDNHTELVTQQNWPQLWNMDARARANLGLPAVVQPSW